MKLKIKVKVLTKGCRPEISSKGDWIDLRAAENMYLSTEGKTPVYYIPLGVAIQLPKGFEAIVASRSSGPKTLKISIPNGIGIIDNSYNGNEDQWYYVATPFSNVQVQKFARVCQFRIQLSQKATLLQKLKWLLSSGIEIIEVDDLNSESRGGLGSTGIK